MLNYDTLSEALGVSDKNLKTVNRTYTTKNGKVSKTYVYDKKDKPLFRSIGGGIYVDIIDKNTGKTRFDLLIDEVKANTKISKADKITIINELKDERSEIMDMYAVYDSSPLTTGFNRIDRRSMLSRLSEGRLDKMAINAGTTVAGLAAQLGITEGELRMAAQNGGFNGNQLNINGMTYTIDFKHHYQGASIFQPV